MVLASALFLLYAWHPVQVRVRLSATNGNRRAFRATPKKHAAASDMSLSHMPGSPIATNRGTGRTAIGPCEQAPSPIYCSSGQQNASLSATKLITSRGGERRRECVMKCGELVRQCLMKQDTFNPNSLVAPLCAQSLLQAKRVVQCLQDAHQIDISPSAIGCSVTGQSSIRLCMQGASHSR